jgi:hypothetical protein
VTSWTARQVVNAAIEDNEALQGERAWYDERIAEHRADLAALDQRIAEAWDHLGSVLVPELAPQLLDDVARRIGLPAIGAQAVERGTQSEIERQRSLLAAAEASPDYQNREGIRNECEIRIAECDELLAPLRGVYASLAEDPRFHRLRAHDYGGERYSGRWWSLSYYRDWKEGDELVEAFGPAMQVADFPAMLRKVVETEAAVSTIQEERGGLTDRLARVERWTAQHDDAALALIQMPQRRLVAVRGAVRGHLQAIEEDELAGLVRGEHDVTVALQRLAGLTAQRRYLVATAERYIFEPHGQLATIQQRNARDLQKLARPKNAGKVFDGEKMRKRFEGRPAAFSKRRERYAQTRHTITSFHDYDRGSLARDFLWWDLMSDGRLDGDFISEVQQHRTHYPDSQHAHAVAAVAERDDPADALLMSDGS